MSRTAKSILSAICNRRKNSDIRADDKEVLAVVDGLLLEISTLEAKLNTPELNDFASGVVSEAQHQRARWGVDHDAGKEPQDWFWLLGYLGGKALKSHADGNVEKALHHCISSAAVLANWHSAILGKTNMRPGIMPPENGDGL